MDFVDDGSSGFEKPAIDVLESLEIGNGELVAIDESLARWVRRRGACRMLRFRAFGRRLGSCLFDGICRLFVRHLAQRRRWRRGNLRFGRRIRRRTDVVLRRKGKSK